MSRLNLYKPVTIALAGSGAALSAASVVTGTSRSSRMDFESLKNQVKSSSEVVKKNLKELEDRMSKLELQLKSNQNPNFEELKNSLKKIVEERVGPRTILIYRNASGLSGLSGESSGGGG